MTTVHHFFTSITPSLPSPAHLPPCPSRPLLVTSSHGLTWLSLASTGRLLL